MLIFHLIQSGGLGPLCSKLSLLEREHKAAAQALDATRHDMVMDGTQPLQEGKPVLLGGWH